MLIWWWIINANAYIFFCAWLITFSFRGQHRVGKAEFEPASLSAFPGLGFSYKNLRMQGSLLIWMICKPLICQLFWMVGNRDWIKADLTIKSRFFWWPCVSHEPETFLWICCDQFSTFSIFWSCQAHSNFL